MRSGLTTSPGGLLHHLFTLTLLRQGYGGQALHYQDSDGRYILCGTFRLFRFNERPPSTTPGHPTLRSPDFPPPFAKATEGKPPSTDEKRRPGTPPVTHMYTRKCGGVKRSKTMNTGKMVDMTTGDGAGFPLVIRSRRRRRQPISKRSVRVMDSQGPSKKTVGNERSEFSTALSSFSIAGARRSRMRPS